MGHTVQFEQARRWPGASLRTVRRRRDHRALNGAITGESLTIPGMVSIGLLVLVGAAMQGYANGTADALLVAMAFLFTGYAVMRLVFPGKQPEQRAFLLSYGICVFVGGLVQCYSLAVWHDPQSDYDAVYAFFPEISSRPPFTTFADIDPLFNSRLAILIWQQVYKLTWLLGLRFGPYTAVMFNALVMGLTASITVATTRELFGNNLWHLRRVGTLFAFCGLFILFGAVLLRDCFTTFFNALVLWGIVCWLVRPTGRNLQIALAVTGISAYAMAYLRFYSVVMFGFFWFLAFLSWCWRRPLNPTRLFIIFSVLFASIIANFYLLSYMRLSREIQSERTESYVGISADASRDDSLGMRLIVHQPMPIRLVVGSGTMMVFPMPLWAYLGSDITDYHLIKTWHGFYQVLVLPLVFAGFLAVFRLFKRDRKRAVPLLFLAVYLLLNWLSVVATSMEQRHLAQFMPAFLILAAVPDTRDRDTQKSLRRIAIAWFALVALLHVAWMLAKAMI
jgi:hypothetical protein